MSRSVSIKSNFFYSSFLTAANYVFTFITYPYVSRVLGVDRIGTVNFIDSVINYFIMLSMLGITIVGVREIAKTKSNRSELNKTYSSILAINAMLTAGALVILFIAYLFVPQLQQNSTLLGLGTMKIVANMFLVDWVVNGLEDFRAITLRTFTVRTLYVIGTFLLVKDEGDYTIYYMLLTTTTVLNALFNVVYLRRFVRFSFSDIDLKRFAAPIFTLGLYVVFNSFYSTFNIMSLGFFAGDTEVGYYTTSTKLFSILLSLFTAFCTVMLPRMSNLLSEDKIGEYKSLLQKSIVLLYAVCIPLMLFSEVHAANIINLVSGKGYEGAIIPMQMCLPLLIVIGHSKIMLQQALMPLGKDRAIFLTSLIGGILAIISCFVFIPALKSIGSATLWIISEIGVNAAAAYFMHKYLSINYPFAKLLKAIVVHLPLFILLWLMRDIFQGYILNLSLGAFLTTVYCVVLQCFVIKDEMIRRLLRIR